MQHMRLRTAATGAAVLTEALGLSACGSNFGQFNGSAELDGTIWCSPNTHSRVAVDNHGKVEVKEGKDVCLEFAQNSGAYVVKVVWWNEAKAIHLEEWAIAVPTSKTTLQYVEADHAGNPDFIGVVGEGEIVMTSDDVMTLMQLGNLIDGAAAGFVTTLNRVDQMPNIPVPLTYPTS